MSYQVTFQQGQLSGLIRHLEHLRNYYAAEASSLSRAAMTREWDGKTQQYTAALIAERMELLHSAEELWEHLLEA